MGKKESPLDEIAAGIREGAALAVGEAHARGLPVFEADDKAIYAIYPDGRRVVVEHLPTTPDRSNPKAA
jgi:hypothetical protein